MEKLSFISFMIIIIIFITFLIVLKQYILILNILIILSDCIFFDIFFFLKLIKKLINFKFKPTLDKHFNNSLILFIFIDIQLIEGLCKLIFI
jgi:hypothetical protein